MLVLGVDEAVEEVFLLAVREFLVALDRVHEIRLLVTAVGVKRKPLELLVEPLVQIGNLQFGEIREPFEDDPRRHRVLRIPIEERKPEPRFAVPFECLVQVRHHEIDAAGERARLQAPLVEAEEHFTPNSGLRKSIPACKS